jgi:methionyl aminopeptidase
VFPSAICTSVNKQLVHGIATDYVLQNGDVVKFDLGATYEGAIADAAATTIYGNANSLQHIELIEVCRKALYKGIEAIKVDKNIGCIGYAISKHVANTSRFGLVTTYGGHGLDYNKAHSSPFIANKSQPTDGIKIQPGLTLAIEPMLVIGEPKTKVDTKDGWTIWVPGIGAHWEHTIFVHADHTEIITDWQEL